MKKSYVVELKKLSDLKFVDIRLILFGKQLGRFASKPVDTRLLAVMSFTTDSDQELPCLVRFISLNAPRLKIVVITEGWYGGHITGWK